MIALAVEPGLRLLLLVALIVLSASFSASETAFFTLTPRERDRAGGHVHRLLLAPRSLLTTILLGNLVVNLLFFSFAAAFAGHGSAIEEIAAGFLAPLIAILVFGEVLPKTVALRASLTIARAAAVPLSVLVPVLTPPRRIAEWLLDVSYRALGRVAQREPRIDQEQLEQVLEASAEQGELLGSEAEFLAGVAELDDLRVREIMTPRVDVHFIDRSDADHGEALEAALSKRLGWLVVVDEGPDHVVGRVRVRDLLVHPDRALDELLVPVRFIPEVSTALALLHFLRDNQAAMAVVVDEWGGTAGLVTLEDIFEEIVGELRVEGEELAAPVTALGDGVFRVSGSLPVRDWNEHFGRRVVPTEFETVAGFVTVLLGRIPRPGDRVRSGGLEFVVHDVRGRRVVSVDMRVEPTEEQP